MVTTKAHTTIYCGRIFEIPAGLSVGKNKNGRGEDAYYLTSFEGIVGRRNAHDITYYHFYIAKENLQFLT